MLTDLWRHCCTLVAPNPRYRRGGPSGYTAPHPPTDATVQPSSITIQPTADDGRIARLAAAAIVLSVAEAAIICGDVQTANATVYIIDAVLLP